MQPWIISALIAVFFGGAAGALINNYFVYRRGKKQPIGITKTITSLLKPLTIAGSHHATITLVNKENKEEAYPFDNLFLISIELHNIGSSDYTEFTVDVSTGQDISMIAIDEVAQGISHKVSYEPLIRLDSPQHLISIKLIPFNRRDKYKLNLYVNNKTDNERILDRLQVDSKLPIEFVDEEVVSNRKQSIIHQTIVSLAFCLSILIVLIFKEASDSIINLVLALIIALTIFASMFFRKKNK